jgi:hypothetical protein
MDSKFQSLQDDKTWIFTFILVCDCTIDDFMARHKVRLVARGFTQVEGG